MLNSNRIPFAESDINKLVKPFNHKQFRQLLVKERGAFKCCKKIKKIHEIEVSKKRLYRLSKIKSKKNTINSKTTMKNNIKMILLKHHINRNNKFKPSRVNYILELNLIKKKIKKIRKEGNFMFWCIDSIFNEIEIIPEI